MSILWNLWFQSPDPAMVSPQKRSLWVTYKDFKPNECTRHEAGSTSLDMNFEDGVDFSYLQEECVSSEIPKTKTALLGVFVKPGDFERRTLFRLVLRPFLETLANPASIDLIFVVCSPGGHYKNPKSPTSEKNETSLLRLERATYGDLLVLESCEEENIDAGKTQFFFREVAARWEKLVRKVLKSREGNRLQGVELENQVQETLLGSIPYQMVAKLLAAVPLSAIPLAGHEDQLLGKTLHKLAANLVAIPPDPALVVARYPDASPRHMNCLSDWLNNFEHINSSRFWRKPWHRGFISVHDLKDPLKFVEVGEVWRRVFNEKKDPVWDHAGNQIHPAKVSEIVLGTNYRMKVFEIRDAEVMRA
ncbi:hypothetical protein HDU93_007403 [Gonapodya sp. JEL0774]|nr:hypothetical protein HDU93_007403 [Gonapodya sp. JEL0774]